MIRSALTVDSMDSLRQLRAEIWRLGPRRFSDIRVSVPGIDQDSNARYSMQFRALYFACGCNEGKVGGGLGLVGAGIWLLSTSGGVREFHPGDLLVAAIVVGAAALLAKFAALGAARHILARSFDQLEHEIAAAAPARVDPGTPPGWT